ncbi:hypothetical protein [Bacillus sp. PS06]|uniref:hypothetical protein n=1 Tax=Bacillus sp. PS06 TaxID=2764176 RepID=UPI0017875428|nr:hypothetical protein [Bacillus sp. PS06]MBD8071051.1 hypothetical protein [Bacillus sp. PS06]
MAKFTQMMDVIFGLTHWVDFTNEWNGLTSETTDVQGATNEELEDISPVVTE